MRLRGSVRLVAACFAVEATSCGGGAPLLYPARTLPTGAVRASLGASGAFAVGSLSDAVSAAEDEGKAGPSHGTPQDPAFTKGALVLASVAPGIAPYSAARVGLGDRFEAGAVYTGRTAHLDVRRSFDWGDVSLSVGLGAETPVYGDSYATTVSGLDLSSVHGYGADIPVLVGWRSDAQIYQLWGGARAGWDRTTVDGVARSPGEPHPTAGDLEATRFYAGGVVGLAAGFRHVHAALELDAAYQSIQGSVGGPTVTLSGWSLAPAGAVWLTF